MIFKSHIELKQITVIVNLKHYNNSSGSNAANFLKPFRNLSIPSGCDVVFALNPIDVRIASDFPELEFVSQHVDSVSYGAHTGQISIEALKDLGIKGSIINHSERRLTPDKVSETIERANKLGFQITVCCESPAEVAQFSSLQPHAIAYEPPELIGGNVSVTSARPEIIQETSDICHSRSVRLLVGAGIKKREDFTRSLELGADGILIASGVVLSSNPFDTLNSLIVNL